MATGLPEGIFFRRRVDSERDFGAKAVGSVVHDALAHFGEEAELGEGSEEAGGGDGLLGEGFKEFVGDEEGDILGEAGKFNDKIAGEFSGWRAAGAVDGAGAAGEAFAEDSEVFAVPPAIGLEVIAPVPGIAADVKFAAIGLRAEGVVDAEDAGPPRGRQDLKRRELLHAISGRPSCREVLRCSRRVRRACRHSRGGCSRLCRRRCRKS